MEYRRLQWSGHVVKMWRQEIAYIQNLVREIRGKSPIELPRRSLKSNIKMGLMDLGTEYGSWINPLKSNLF
jgi:hypothetical protein